jgi:4-aminobutyrate aminotransferase-like enzyme
MPMGQIRGLGAMIAFELVTEHGGSKPDAAGAKALAAKCLERGLLILTCGVFNDTIRLLCPLSAPEKIVEEGLDILEAALTGN